MALRQPGVAVGLLWVDERGLRNFTIALQAQVCIELSMCANSTIRLPLDLLRIWMTALPQDCCQLCNYCSPWQKTENLPIMEHQMEMTYKLGSHRLS